MMIQTTTRTSLSCSSVKPPGSRTQNGIALPFGPGDGGPARGNWREEKFSNCHGPDPRPAAARTAEDRPPGCLAHAPCARTRRPSLHGGRRLPEAGAAIHPAQAV